MRSAVLLLNFGEPETPARDGVVPYLERIFGMNDHLEGRSGESARERARSLAEARAPDLIAEYELIGGSPLWRQSQEQADLLEAELTRRGCDVVCILGMQFTEPFISEAVRRARAAGVQQIIALPVYPLCGPSTTLAALTRLRADLGQQLWRIPVHEVSGWHRHADYLDFRADAIRRALTEHNASFDDPRTKLVFSAHGTPMKYIREGSRYEVYVRDFCACVAERLGVQDYLIGYQNHRSRPIEWTQPDIEQVIADVDADRIIVDAVSFMHEQSETLVELDRDLHDDAQRRGIDFIRVPIEHAAPEFIEFLGDLVEPFVRGEGAGGKVEGLRKCGCREGGWCTNRDLVP